jgi:ClpP class serine protease
LLQEDVDKIHKNFVSNNSENRKLAIEKVEELATGASMLGEKAFEKGLIDEIGGIAEVKAYLASQINDEVRICILPPAPAQ